MSAPADAFLRYLGRYLAGNPAGRAKLFAAHLTTTGRTLNRKTVWRHTSGLIYPNAETTLVYLVFLHKAGELIPVSKRGALFEYKHPAWLKPKT
jgi:hypothetical protein